MLGLDLMCASGVILWWRRRDQGVLGVSRVTLRPRLSFGLLALIVTLGVYLPLFVAFVARCRSRGEGRAQPHSTRPQLAGAACSRGAGVNLKTQALGGTEMSSTFKFTVLVIALSTFSGCGARPVAGGTKGVLHYAGKTPSDIQVTVYQLEGGKPKPIGFGVTTNDGSFRLVTNMAAGALWLSQGDYRCTLESVGVPIRVPKEYASAETTPLKVSLSGGGESLDLEVPSQPTDAAEPGAAK